MSDQVSAASGLDVAVDIGGTFTDLVAVDAQTGRVVQAKSLTTPLELSQGVWDCLRKAGIAPRESANLIHGSTVAINIAIEEKGARTALVVTSGTRDVYKIGRQNRPDAYNFAFRRPVPLVPRSRTFEVAERLSSTGFVLLRLDPKEVEAIALQIRDSGSESVAVCFLHSYANPAHEIEAGRILRKILKNAYISLSHEIVREYREYERTSTTVMNAYVGPKTSEYIARMQARLDEENFAGRFLVMQSSGGVMSPESAKTLPVAMMESGPVGGVIAASEIGRRIGIRNVIAFDMGGTTAKTSLIRDGAVSVAHGYHIGGYAGGHPVMFPVVDIVEVGAGGGSIAWIDEVGALKLGPQSAGSAPGPICYGSGGTRPTVTDANVVLGRIGASSFLGGEMPLDVAAARRGIAEQLCPRLGLGIAEVARGIVSIAVAKMALAVRGVSVQRGHDPRDFALLAMGGGGPLHAIEIARELAIPRVVIPNLPAHFSALGMLMSDVRHDFVRTCYRLLHEADVEELETIFAALAATGAHAIDRAGIAPAARALSYFMDLRYVGQEFTLQIPLARDELLRGDIAAIRHRFDATHEQRFGHAAPEEPVELVNLRLTSRGMRPKLAFPALHQDGPDPQIGTRPIVLDGAGRSSAACPVYRRELLSADSRLSGPCAIEELGSTTILLEGDAATVTSTGEIIVEVARP
jgi:N-methylhydantoinase A